LQNEQIWTLQEKNYYKLIKNIPFHELCFEENSSNIIYLLSCKNVHM
jgi:hypothetical protein